MRVFRKRSLAVLAVAGAAVALSSTSAAAASRCRSNIDGDHIALANDFQVSGINCANAVKSAVGYTDSAKQIENVEPGTVRFTAELDHWRYRWTCRMTEL